MKLQHKCLPLNIRKFLRTANLSWDLWKRNLFILFLCCLLGKVKKVYWNSFTVKRMWYSVIYQSIFFHLGNGNPSPTILKKFGWYNQLNLLVIHQVCRIFFNSFTKKREVLERIFGPIFSPILLYPREQWPEIK